jgi:hypothetical protein
MKMFQNSKITSFPQFSLLPAELRRQIWETALAPPPKISTITLSYTRWDPLEPQAYDGPSFEIAQGSLWYFAFAPSRTLPAILFTSQEAFSIGQRYYHVAQQLGHEIVDETIISDLTTLDGEIVVEGYSSSMPVIERRERAVLCSTNDLVHVTINPKVSVQEEELLSHHAISDLHPLTFQGIKYLVMDAMEFYNRMYVMSSNSLVFVGLEVLFLVMGHYDGIRNGGWEIPGDGAVDMWAFLKPWERTDLEAGTKKWGVKEVQFVGSVEEAMEMVGERDA